MAFSPVLDLATGLVLIYFLFSVLCSALVELLSRIFSLRQRMLAQGIYLLLGHPVPKGYFKKLIAGTGEAAGADGAATAAALDLPTRVLLHPLVRGLGQAAHEMPSHIPPRTFVMALLDELAPPDAEGRRSMNALRASIDKVEPPALRRILVSALAHAEDQWDQLIALLEARFEHAMDRVSAWYKRRSQILLFLLGLGVAAAANVDSIHVSKSLWRDSTLRSALVAEAATLRTSPAAGTVSTPQQSAEDARKLASGIVLPIGWENPPKWSDAASIFWSALGLLLTAIALALGAPFWFDVLSRVASVRSATPPPADAPKLPATPP